MVDTETEEEVILGSLHGQHQLRDVVAVEGGGLGADTFFFNPTVKVIMKFFIKHNKSFGWHLGDYEKHNFFFHLRVCERRNFDFCVFLRMCVVCPLKPVYISVGRRHAAPHTRAGQTIHP